MSKPQWSITSQIWEWLLPKEKKQVLEKIRSAVEIQISAVTMENRMHIPKKIKNRTYSLDIPLLGVYA